MALLGRHAVIHRFGIDQFTGNVLFAVFFVLSIGLYCGFQSVIEDVFNRLSTLFRRREVMAIVETTTGEQIAIPTVEELEPSMMECSAPVQGVVAENYPEMTFPNDYNEEIEEDAEYLTLEDGTRIKIGAIDIDDVVFDSIEDNITEYSSLQDTLTKKRSCRASGNPMTDAICSDTTTRWSKQSRGRRSLPPEPLVPHQELFRKERLFMIQ